MILTTAYSLNIKLAQFTDIIYIQHKYYFHNKIFSFSFLIFFYIAFISLLYSILYNLFYIQSSILQYKKHY